MSSENFRIVDNQIPPSVFDCLDDFIGRTVHMSLDIGLPVSQFFRGTFGAATGPLGRHYHMKTASNPYHITLNLHYFTRGWIRRHPALGILVVFVLDAPRSCTLRLSESDPVDYMDNEFTKEHGWTGEPIGAPTVTDASIEYRPS